MKRFFYLAAVLMVALFVGSCAAEQKEAEPKNVGIQLYSVLSSVIENPEATIERLSKLGYNQVELVQWGGDPQVFGMSAAEFKALCDKYGVAIISTHSGIQEEPENEEAILARWRAAFASVKECGGRYFIVPGYGVDYTVEGLQQMCAYFNKIGKIAKEEFGLEFGYHNHSHEYTMLKDTDIVMWEYLVENTDPEYVCFELDVYWCHEGGKSPEAYLAKYPERIKLLHVKDEFVIGESGKINFEAIFNQFYANGMKDYVVEIETPQFLREKTNEDGTPYTQEQIVEETFLAAEKSAAYLNEAAFVK
ncbi:MAG: sugar phosphate isomerase/epimerase [Alistipes sp.]|nr:sugar phosphate isomerase/epimerase [Alistipes sp.]